MPSPTTSLNYDCDLAVYWPAGAAALGQLLDYKRFYARSPSLAVLLPQKPDASTLELLADYRVTVIWETRPGRFEEKRPDPD